MFFCFFLFCFCSHFSSAPFLHHIIRVFALSQSAIYVSTTRLLRLGFFDWNRCYDELGCFEPRLLIFFPHSPQQLKTRFLLNSPANPDVKAPTIVDYLDIRSSKTSLFGGDVRDGSGSESEGGSGSVRSSDEEKTNDSIASNGSSTFDPSLPVKILVHGFIDSPSDQKWMRLTKELLRWRDVNVVRVDWSNAVSGSYNRASANAQLVGAQIAIFMRRLVQVRVYG